MFNSFIADTEPKPYNNYGPQPTVPFVVKDITIGPTLLNDTSKGLNDKYWAAYFDPITEDLIIEDLELLTTTVILNEPDTIINVALAFDQSANDTYAYITGLGELKLRWFDAEVPGDTILDLGPAQSVVMTMDTKYYPSSPTSDILIFYIRNSAIYYRIQRDKYAIEYATPVTSGASRLLDSGTTTGYRFQVRWK